jgi:flagellar hook protein FlgE
MGIYGALNNAVSGLQSQAYALEQISGNIANSQTVGYKRAETSFADMVPMRRQVGSRLVVWWPQHVPPTTCRAPSR